MNPTTPQALTLTCSFCNKPNDRVEKLVAGPGVFICDECIALAASIVENERRSADAAREPTPLDDRPNDELLKIFGGMAGSINERLDAANRWAEALAARGVTDEQLAQAAGLTVDQLHERFGS